MTEDRFFDKLREDCTQLRYEPRDGALWARLPGRIRDRIHNQPSVSQMLARWFRPITVAFAALSIVAALSVTWIEHIRETAYAVEAMGSNSLEITVDGDTFNLTAAE
ncbi:MAG TPA: hypothetical protein VKL19_10050 [Thermoanaerobaculia bacterium]|nr:hypothetical protein [Thermoanaerobaculia bacterium]